MIKVVADSAIPFLKEALEGRVELVCAPGVEIDKSMLSSADALIVRTRTRCDRALLEESSIGLLSTATIGFDHIDIDYCHSQGIEVTTAAGCNARGVLQWVAAALVSLLRRVGSRPEELTLGVVGVGHVGSLVKEYAEMWGFRVLCCDPPRQAREGGDFVTLEQIARQCDIITFHTPFDETTYHLCNADILAMTRPESIIINTSRGAVVDNLALLKSGRRCALDVWEWEPRVSRELLERAELATPHIAGYSLQGKANATSIVVEALNRKFRLNLGGWYPPSVRRSNPMPISWEELSQTIFGYFDIEAQSMALKSAPEHFEHMRDRYSYREEYF